MSRIIQANELIVVSELNSIILIPIQSRTYIYFTFFWAYMSLENVQYSITLQQQVNNKLHLK